jgi:hypothetical protein
VGGFKDQLICGEEPELCWRLRTAGWQIERLGWDMTEHDAAMLHWGQWWRRQARGGWAFAEGMAMHGTNRERYDVKPALSALGWGGVLPIIMLATAWPTAGWSLILMGAYPMQMLKTSLAMRRAQYGWRDSAAYAVSCILGKFAELEGVVRFWLNRWRGKPATLIEYKQQPLASHDRTAA